MTLCLFCGNKDNKISVQCSNCRARCCLKCSVNGLCKDCYISMENAGEIEIYNKEKYKAKI